MKEEEKFLLEHNYHKDFDTGAYVNKDLRNVFSETYIKDYPFDKIKELHDNSTSKSANFFFEERVSTNVRKKFIDKYRFLDEGYND